MKRLMISAMALAMLAGGAGAAAAQPFDHGPRPDGYHSQWNHPNWRRGDHINRADWGRGVVVDYRAHHLRRPPRGYQWRQVDGRYVLAAVATGVIADIILNAR
jgi:Ni/Co efflux regulator RcnB